MENYNYKYQQTSLNNLSSGNCPEHIRNLQLKKINDNTIAKAIKEENFPYYSIKRSITYNENDIKNFTFSIKKEGYAQNSLNNWIEDSNLFYLKPYLHQFMSSSQPQNIFKSNYDESDELVDFISKFNKKIIFPEFCLRSFSETLLHLEGRWFLYEEDSLLYLRLTFQFSLSFLKFLNYYKQRNYYESAFQDRFEFYEKHPYLAESLSKPLTSDKCQLIVDQIMTDIIKTSYIDLFKKKMIKEELEETEKLIIATKINYQKIFENSNHFTNFLINFNMEKNKISPPIFEIIKKMSENIEES